MLHAERAVVVCLLPPSLCWYVNTPQTVTWHGAHTFRQQAADTCAETCIGNNFNDSELVNACMRRCEQSLPLINQTVQQELTNLQVRTTACIAVAAVAVGAMFRDGGRWWDYSSSTAVVQMFVTKAFIAVLAETQRR